MQLTSSTVISKKTYQTTQFGATKAVKGVAILGKILGGPVGTLAGAPGGLAGLMKGAGNADVFGKAVTELFGNLDENKIDEYLQFFLSETTVGGGSESVLDGFDIRFQGKLPELFQVLKWVLQVNFGDFLRGLTGQGGAAPAAE